MSVYLSLLLAVLGLTLLWGALITRRLRRFSVINRIATALLGISFLWQIQEILQYLINDAPLFEDMLVWWTMKDIGIVLWACNIFYVTAVQDREICLRGDPHHG